MNYKFPKIEKIGDVINSIKGYDGFTIHENDGCTSISYRIVSKDMFFGKNFDVKRECRGIMFDHFGNLIARPYHKFFNLGENEETRPEKVDLSRPHVIMEKLDGSMVFPFRRDGKDFMLATKAGPTDIAIKAYEDCIVGNSLRQAWINSMLDRGLTPIFEYMAPDNRIVLHYEEPRLCLTGIREMHTGTYFNVYGQRFASNLFDLPDIYSKDVLEKIKDMESMEGIVIRFQDGHMIKVKTAWYLLRHGLIDISKNPWRVINAHLEGDLDDAIAEMDDPIVDDVNGIIDAFWKRIHEFYDAFRKESRAIADKKIERKDYMKAFPLYEGSMEFKEFMPMAIFRYWDDYVTYEDFECDMSEYVTKDRNKFRKFMKEFYPI